MIRLSEYIYIIVLPTTLEIIRLILSVIIPQAISVFSNVWLGLVLLEMAENNKVLNEIFLRNLGDAQLFRL